MSTRRFFASRQGVRATVPCVRSVPSPPAPTVRSVGVQGLEVKFSSGPAGMQVERDVVVGTLIGGSHHVRGSKLDGVLHLVGDY